MCLVIGEGFILNGAVIFVMIAKSSALSGGKNFLTPTVSHIILCHCPVARVDLNYLTRKTSVQNMVDTVEEEKATGRGKI